jgi:ferredoxin
MYLVAPVNIAAKDGKVTGIRMRNQVLGETDSGGRRTPEAVETAEFTLACDTVVAAIGQQTEPVEGVVGDGYAIRVQADTLKVCDGVYAGGDAVEVKTIIAAVAAGKKAAVSMDKAMRGHDAVLEYEPAGGVVDKDTVLKRTGYFKDDAPISLETVSGKDRAQNFAPYTRTMTEEEAVAEASRCLACGCGEGCGICASICSEFTIDVDGYDKIRIDDSGCVACGMCFNRCPNDNIEMVSTGQTV